MSGDQRCGVLFGLCTDRFCHAGRPGGQACKHQCTYPEHVTNMNCKQLADVHGNNVDGELLFSDLCLLPLVIASAAAATGFDSCLRCGDFSGSSHTSDLKIATPVATMPGAWRHRVSAGTGWPDVSTLWLSEVESLICNFYLCVTTHKSVWADPHLSYTSMLLWR